LENASISIGEGNYFPQTLLNCQSDEEPAVSKRTNAAKAFTSYAKAKWSAFRSKSGFALLDADQEEDVRLLKFLISSLFEGSKVELFRLAR
jgi:hypothetical protein